MKRYKARRTRAGFTMVELMAVLIILGLLFAMVVGNYVGHTDKARKITTQTSLKSLHTLVNQFKMDTGRYPAEEEGLGALLEQPTDVTNWPAGGYLDTTEIPMDGWDHDFIYELNPTNGKPFLIKSLGADGQDDGEGYDADLLSTDAN